MESQQNTNYLKVFYLIIISILVATSALLEPLISPRPDDPEQILKHKTYVDIHKVESRLWQDPLATIERRYHQLNGSSVNSDLSIDKQIKSFTKQLNSKRIEKN